MIKGVNRSIIEVKDLENPVFERVLCFVRPECCTGGRTDLQTTAENYVRTLIEPNDTKSRKLPVILRIGLPAAAAVLGFAAGMLVK